MPPTPSSTSHRASDAGPAQADGGRPVSAPESGLLAPAPSPDGLPPRGVAAAPTILIVDDSATMRVMLSRVLERWGCTVLVATDGAAALSQARHAKPDLILMDILIPGLDGVGVTRELKSDPATRAIPVIALTGLGGPDAGTAFTQAGFEAYLRKPVDWSALRERIDKLVEA